MSGNREAFYDPPAREWFKNWIDPEFGPMVDVVRQCWPERKGMYTCARDEIYSLSQNCLIVFQAGYQNLRTRDKLRHKDRLHSSLPWPTSVVQAWRHYAVRARL